MSLPRTACLMYALKFRHPKSNLGSCYLEFSVWGHKCVTHALHYPCRLPLSSGTQISAQTLALFSWDISEHLVPPCPAIRTQWFLECDGEVSKCPETFLPYLPPPDHQMRTLKKQNHLFNNLLSEITFMTEFAVHFCTKNFMKWKWLNSSGRAWLQTASSQIPEVWGLGSPQHVLFNKHSHTWPFTLAAACLPSQCLELSTLALAPWSLGSAFQVQVDLGWAPHMAILVRVENLRHRFLQLASLQNFLVLKACATSSWHWAKVRALAHQKSMFTELDLAFGNSAIESMVRKVLAEPGFGSTLGLFSTCGHIRLSLWHSQYILQLSPLRTTLSQGVLYYQCTPRHFTKTKIKTKQKKTNIVCLIFLICKMGTMGIPPRLWRSNDITT